MPIPDFVAELRRCVGRAELWLPGATAVILRDHEVLLVLRSDNGTWAPVTGIIDPGEEPAACARREAREETGVEIRVERLASVSVTPPVIHANGDRARYLDHTFACRWLSGRAHVADDESTEVAWFPLDALPMMKPQLVERITVAASDQVAARFSP